MTGMGEGDLRERDHWRDAGADMRIILIRIFSELDVGYGLDRSGSGQGQMAGTFECSNEPWGTIKCGEFLE